MIVQKQLWGAEFNIGGATATSKEYKMLPLIGVSKFCRLRLRLRLRSPATNFLWKTPPMIRRYVCSTYVCTCHCYERDCSSTLLVLLSFPNFWIRRPLVSRKSLYLPSFATSSNSLSALSCVVQHFVLAPCASLPSLLGVFHFLSWQCRIPFLKMLASSAAPLSSAVEIEWRCSF